MKFHVIPRNKRLPEKERDIVYLKTDGWDDYSFRTSFMLHYFDENSEEHKVGFLKIGFKGQKEGQTTSGVMPPIFESLDDNFFSLGQTEDFYQAIFKLGEVGLDILEAINDVVKNQNLIKTLQEEEVFSVSLLRDMSLGVVEEEFGRALNGKAALSNFHFSFKRESSKDLGELNLDFKVKRNSTPPSNIHAIIGANGSGKTTILNGMINAVAGQSFVNGKFYDEDERLDLEIGRNYFGRVISVAFSAFDPFIPPKDREDPAKGPCYTYIGLKDRNDNNRHLHIDELYKGCVSALLNIFYARDESKLEQWSDAINKLSSDYLFKEIGLKKFFEVFEKIKHELKRKEKHQEKVDLYFDETKDIFYAMSTGHAIVFITITRLVSKVELKTLVLMDEPESHLHPPLLSSFIRALSDLLVEQNGVAILATHSPVVLQEIPMACISVIDRSGKKTTVKRPPRETFAENVGLLTYDVFSLALRESGFYSLFNEYVDKGMSFEQIIEEFNDNIGIEGRSVLLSIFSGRQKRVNND